MQKRQSTALGELYHRLLDDIHERKLNANISLKLTHMGFDVSEDWRFAWSPSWWITPRASTTSFASGTLEGSPYTQRTLDFVRQLHRQPGHAGKSGRSSRRISTAARRTSMI